MKQSQFKSYDDLPLFLNAKWGPSGNVKHFRWERRSSGMTEPLPTGEGEGYGACDDEVAQVLGVAPSSAYVVVAKSAPLRFRLAAKTAFASLLLLSPQSLRAALRGPLFEFLVMVVPKEKFIQWVEQNTEGSGASC